MTDEANKPEPVTEEMAATLMRQAELYLQAQLQVGIASDQRAMTMAAIFSSIGAAAAAGAIAYWDRTSDVPILISGLVGSLMMIGGAFTCLWAARPIDFHFPGNHPESWFPVIRCPLSDVMLGEAENYQSHMEANDKCLQQNSTAVIRGAAVAVAAPLVASLLWIGITVTCPTCANSTSSPEATEPAVTHSPSSSDEISRTSP